ncbi:flagellar basal body-associated FliL family protein [Aquabacterium sp. A7-Y]|uniref:flagellar basal body-associated FliL family protein n=1 Tax=Aquabacterium sp. A7-Y TaxID=1349605 RepID=UPI00223D33DA|nr:flagellar basal body-associated FliL family protein [Aquabacterium sp. A7-Y]MCW7540559.1 flagellar basal body-associated FliL family protein [Aquabacterium sp. A7-Y]
MSAAATADASAPKKSPKKLILGIVAGVVVLLVAAAVALMMMKKSGAEEDAEEDTHAEQEHKPKKASGPPVFLPLDPFTVNLADKDSERYAQVGITLEVDSPESAEELKGYMPAIRNNVLMVLSHKTAEELLDRSGKEKLAAEIMREAVRPMGIELDDENAEADEEDTPKPKKKKKKKKTVHNPVHQVLFSNFIIQ